MIQVETREETSQFIKQIALEHFSENKVFVDDVIIKTFINSYRDSYCFEIIVVYKGVSFSKFFEIPSFSFVRNRNVEETIEKTEEALRDFTDHFKNLDRIEEKEKMEFNFIKIPVFNESI